MSGPINVMPPLCNRQSLDPNGWGRKCALGPSNDSLKHTFTGCLIQINDNEHFVMGKAIQLSYSSALKIQYFMYSLYFTGFKLRNRKNKKSNLKIPIRKWLTCKVVCLRSCSRLKLQWSHCPCLDCHPAFHTGCQI